MKLATAVQLVRHLGPRWMAYRLGHALSQKAGLLRRRAPVAAWQQTSLADFTDSHAADPDCLAENLRRRPFFFSPADRERYQPLLRQFDGQGDWTSPRLKELSGGQIRFFSGELRGCGWPPRWHDNVLTAQAAPRQTHFSQIPEFNFGDVKVIWEPSRFSFVFDLVRIYWRSGDERCPTLFWQAVEDWRQHNPPNAGINWKCGQESSLRAFAWCFGLWGFLDSPQSTPQRLAMLATLLAATARRVEANIRYALSQKNNHGISEAAGLLTVGLLLPQLRNAARWERRGRGLLETQARELVYDDGGFSQYSANYHRVMLDDYLWAIRLAAIADRPMSRALVQRVVGAARFLLAIEDDQTGGVPRYGQDDGASVLPLANTGYDDYRATLQAAVALDPDAALPHRPGPWNEKLLWLFGPEALQRNVEPPARSDAWKDSGYGLLRRENDFAFVRGGWFAHRPSQADLLHLDLWWRGRNVAMDPGTYSYNATGVWGSIPFAGTACHNTVGVDGLDQVQRVSRFLFLPWPHAPKRRLLRSPGGQIGLLEAEHDGYRRLADPVTHRRTVVQLGPEHWLVADQLIAAGQHDYRLHWLLTDAPHEFDPAANRLTLTLDASPYTVQLLAAVGLDVSLARAENQSARGWYAPRYQQRAPALSLAAVARGGHARLFTVLGPGRWDAALDRAGIHVAGDRWRADLGLTAPDAPAPLAAVRWQGEQNDQLELT